MLTWRKTDFSLSSQSVSGRIYLYVLSFRSSSLIIKWNDPVSIFKINCVIYFMFQFFLTRSEKALERLPENHQLLMHSDQGWHYQMRQYVRTLESRAIVQSMSRKGNCYDNAVIENFFGIMKSEFLYIKEFENVEHFKIELEKYIDYYNTKRIKAKLKMSPVQYRTHFYQAA